MNKYWSVLGALSLVVSNPAFADANLHGTTLHASTLHAFVSMLGLHPIAAATGFLAVVGVVVYRLKAARIS